MLKDRQLQNMANGQMPGSTRMDPPQRELHRCSRTSHGSYVDFMGLEDPPKALTGLSHSKAAWASRAEVPIEASPSSQIRCLGRGTTLVNFMFC